MSQILDKCPLHKSSPPPHIPNLILKHYQALRLWKRLGLSSDTTIIEQTMKQDGKVVGTESGHRCTYILSKHLTSQSSTLRLSWQLPPTIQFKLFRSSNGCTFFSHFTFSEIRANVTIQNLFSLTGSFMTSVVHQRPS